MCPLAKRRSLTETRTWMTYPPRSGNPSVVGNRPRRHVVYNHGRLLHGDRVAESGNPLSNPRLRNHYQQTRHGSTFLSSKYRIDHRGEVRSHVSQDHLANSDQHGTLKPSFMKSRYIQSLMVHPTIAGFPTPVITWKTLPRHMSTSLSSKGLSTLGSASESGTRASTAPIHISPTTPPIHSLPSFLSRPTFASLTTAAQDSSPSNFVQHVRKGRRKLISEAIQHRRHQKLLKRRESSSPQHPSLLLGVNRTIPLASASRRSQKELRRARHRRWDSSPHGGLRVGGRSRRYLHVHFYRTGLDSSRKQFLSFQDFLKYSKIMSPRGQEAYRNERKQNDLKMMHKLKNSRLSCQNSFSRILRRLLMTLAAVPATEEIRGQNAVRLAKIVLKSKGKGSPMPSTSALYKLCRLEFQNLTIQLRHSKSGVLTVPPNKRFSTEDYNTILEHCETLEDWKYGTRIAFLQRRMFRREGFDYHSSELPVPNTRTIHLMASIFVKGGRLDTAEELFNFLHDRYPHPIPIDVYTAYLRQLATVPDQTHRMEQLVKYLTENGPAPTTTIYNIMLKRRAFQQNPDRGRAFLDQMSKLGCAPDLQSFNILISASLEKLDISGAYYWLGECERQGFEIRSRMLLPFMRTYVEQMNRCKNLPESVDKAPDVEFLSQAWMYNALQLFQFMKSRGIEPIAPIFELLIRGFLLQDNVPEARKSLNIMRGRPHLYTPSPRIWTFFFHYHLSKGDHSSAMGILNEMRKAIRTPASPNARAPIWLYHQLYLHLLQRNKGHLAERTLYEMMIRQGRAQPTPKEVVDLIWKLGHQPKDAERVYELLYSQTLVMPKLRGKNAAGSRLNAIMVEGPIQMANVGVMRAKANSKDSILQDEVWKTWISMTHYFMDQQNNHGLLDQTKKPLKSIGQRRSVLGIAFEQVAKALHVVPAADHQMSPSKPSVVESGWDMGQIRRLVDSDGDGSRTQPTFGASSIPTSTASNRSIQFTGKARHLIQHLFQQKDFLQPLLDRREMSATSDETFMSVNASGADRLEKLKSSFRWVQDNNIPFKIEGFNCYLESLLSHQDYETARDITKRLLLEDCLPSESDEPRGLSPPPSSSSLSLSSSTSSSSSSTSSSSSSSSLMPNVNTIIILRDHRRLLPQGQELFDQVMNKGGPELAEEWSNWLARLRRHGKQQ